MDPASVFSADAFPPPERDPFAAVAVQAPGDGLMHALGGALGAGGAEATPEKPVGRVIRGSGVVPEHVNRDRLAFIHPSRASLVGASGSGKTFFLVDLLDKPRVVPKGTAKLPKGQKTRKMWANYDAVVWMAPKFSLEQPIIKRLKKKMGDQLTLVPVEVGPGLSDEQLKDLNKILDDNSAANLQTAMVNDDLVAATTDKTTLQFLKELAISGRHRNASLLTLTQRAFTAGSRTTRLQQDYWVIFRVGASEVTQLLRQLYPVNWRPVFAAYKRATESVKPGAYLMIDTKSALSPSTDRRVLQFRDSSLDRVVTGVLPDS